VCGSEARGPGHASAELFEGATWFLTPVAETEPERYKLLHGFVASLGAVPVAIDPGAHDRLMAVTSHLPHALANLILNHAGSVRVNGHEPLATAGGSLRDMTRVAGANPRIWIDIFLDNAEELRASLAEHRRRVEDLERALAAGDAGWLARWIGEAAVNRRVLLDEAYRDVGTLQRVRVHVPDRPGVLSGITQALGAEQINIEGFEFFRKCFHIVPGLGELKPVCLKERLVIPEAVQVQEFTEHIVDAVHITLVEDIHIEDIPELLGAVHRGQIENAVDLLADALANGFVGREVARVHVEDIGSVVGKDAGS
jgi:hypothetical protein